MWHALKRWSSAGKCGFCGKAVHEVSHLIAGKRSAICQLCATDVIRLLARSAPEDTLSLVLHGVLLDRASDMTTNARQALALALAELGSLPFHGDVIQRLGGLGDAAATYPLLMSSKRFWTSSHWVTVSWACAKLGLFDDVIQLANELPENALAGADHGVLFDMNVIWARCCALPAPTADALREHLASLERCRGHWAERLEGSKADAFAQHCLCCVDGTAARCFVLLGDDEAALKCLDRSTCAPADADPDALLVWGDILERRGNHADAVEKWRSAARCRATAGCPNVQVELRKRLG